MLAVIIVLMVAFVFRSLSLQWSTLPYNIDGLSEVRVANDIMASGNLDFPPKASYADTYVADMPILGLFVAFTCSTVGIEPVDSIQILAALLGVVAVVLALLVFRQYWPSSKGSLATVLVLALTGSFVFSAGCTWKETLGFVLVLLALYSFPLRSSLPHRYVLTSSLLLLPFTHHHATVVGFVIITFAFVFEYANWRKGPTFSQDPFTDALTIAGAWFVAILYYDTVNLPYLDYLSPRTDLYLFLAVASLLLIVGVKASRKDRPLSKLPIALAVPVIGALVMAYNYFRPIFPGTPAPAALIAVPFLAYLILVVPAWTGAQIALANKGPGKNMVLAMVLGPLSLILFAFLRALDDTSYTIIYRTFDFLMPAFAILVGLGFAALVKGRERLGIAAGISLVIVCASTLPIAYSTQELFGVENQTYWFEYDAFEWFSEHDVSKVASDQRLSETGTRLFDIEGARGLPFDLREGLSLSRDSFFVVEGQWTTKGAQEFPLGVVVIEEQRIAGLLGDNSVVFVGGPLENHLTGFVTR